MNECSCSKCQKACQRVPGWFRPGEAEKVAEFLDLSMQDLFDQYLGVRVQYLRTVDTENEDGIDECNEVLLLAPAVTRADAGYPYYGVGVCTFFKNGRCQIHPVKPFECADCMPCDKTTYVDYDRKSNITIEMWSKTSQPRDLLNAR